MLKENIPPAESSAPLPLRKPFLTPRPQKFKFFLKQNYFFFGSCLLLLIVAYYFVFTRQVGDVLVALNGYRSGWRDNFFIFFTQFAEPQAYLAVIVFYICFRYRSAIFAVGCGAAAGVVSAILKTIFSHARPLRYLYDNAIDIWGNLVLFDQDVYNNSWAYTSFPSGHAMSAFALYSFIVFNANRWKIPVSVLCFVLATMVCLSRMYLLMHFMKDVTVGATVGVLIGAAMYYLQFRLFPNKQGLDRGLINRNKAVMEG